MPEIITQKGLVLHETAYGESDKIIDILTDSGIRTVRVRGARKAGSKNAAATQAFSYCEFCLQKTRGRYYLDSAAPLNLFYPLRTDLSSLALAAYFSELTKSAATDQPQPEILRLFLICLHYLAEQKRSQAQIKAAFELRLLTELGMMPNLICCAECCEFIPVQPVLRIDKADMVCAECADTVGNEKMVTQAALLAARHVVFSDLDKVLSFRVTGRSLRLFAQYAEQYTIYHLERSFPALRYYKDISFEDT